MLHGNFRRKRFILLSALEIKSLASVVLVLVEDSPWLCHVMTDGIMVKDCTRKIGWQIRKLENKKGPGLPLCDKFS